MFTASRYHDVSCGHRVWGHEGKCRHLHGHNYRIHFHCRSLQLDGVGRVLDFSVIKSCLCEWVEQNWDHKFLIWNKDPCSSLLYSLDGPNGVVIVPFNPTAENMAEFLVREIGPNQLKGSGVTLYKVEIEETRKCSAAFEMVGVQP